MENINYYCEYDEQHVVVPKKLFYGLIKKAGIYSEMQKIALPKKSKKSDKDIRFVIPPTVEMVKAYCDERRNGLNASNFIDHYTANGWKVGKNKMVDWQASVRTWERNHPELRYKDAKGSYTNNVKVLTNKR